VLRSRTSAALAAAIMLDKKTIATTAVRIDFIYEPPNEWVCTPSILVVGLLPFILFAY
jgi:hypothetical protein